MTDFINRDPGDEDHLREEIHMIYCDCGKPLLIYDFAELEEIQGPYSTGGIDDDYCDGFCSEAKEALNLEDPK